MLGAMNRRLALVLGCTQTLAWATSFYMPTVLAPTVARALDVSTTALLGGFTWALLLAALLAPVVGRWIDRHGGRDVLVLSSFILALGLVVMASVPNLMGWYLGWTIEGLGMALGLYDAAFATIGRLLGSAARPCIVGVTLIAGFASTLGWPMGVALEEAVGWRATLFVFAAINALINLPCVLLLVPRAIPPYPPAPAESISPHRLGVSLILLSVFLSIREAIGGVFALHVLVLFQGIGLSVAAAVATAALMGPSQVFGRILEWGFKGRLNPLVASLLGALLLPLGVVALFLGGPAPVFIVLYGMSNGILTISRGTLPLYLFGPHGYASRLGLLALPQMLCKALAPTLVAPLVVEWPAENIFIGMGVLAALAMLCLLPLRRGPGGD
ncbi:MAG: MFS transporter [Acetobacteraceae bacterium]|nr:MFS transporter [Acetobacteraceae bacterium]